MEPTQFNEIISRLDAFLASAGALGQQAWPILVRQQQTGATIALIAQIFGLFVFLAVSLGSVVCIRKAYDPTTDNDGLIGYGIFLALVALVILFVVLVNVSAAIQPLMNPEYFAMKDAIKILVAK